MKKFLLILLLIGLFAGMSFAAVVTERKINKTPTGQSNVQKNTGSSTKKPEQKTLSTSIKTCKPYSETMKSDYLGMSVNYKIIIAGWINNKCRLDFTAQTDGVSSSFESMYGIDPSDASLYSFMPKIRCEFTKQQLEYVGDSILQEEERNAGAKNNMLKDPNTIDLTDLSTLNEQDAKLMDVIFGSNACQILNMDDLNNIMQSKTGVKYENVRNNINIIDAACRQRMYCNTNN